MYLPFLINYLQTTLVNDCIRDCSNNGLCKAVNETHLLCECDQYYDGKECEFSLKPCLLYPCLNNGECIEIIYSPNNLTFECNCTENYYGPYCENKINICQNETCSMNGICQDKENKAECNCFYLYEGQKCEITSSELQTIKSVISITSILAIIILVAFCILICSMDLLKLCMRRKKQTRKITKIKKQNLKYIN